MKIDLSLAEKKAVRKDERIALLERTLAKEREIVRKANGIILFSLKTLKVS